MTIREKIEAFLDQQQAENPDLPREKLALMLVETADRMLNFEERLDIVMNDNQSQAGESHE